MLCENMGGANHYTNPPRNHIKCRRSIVPSELSRERAALAWCTEKTRKIEMDVDLAEAFAEILDDVCSQPRLGHATTSELIEELKARVDLQYKTRRADD